MKIAVAPRPSEPQPEPRAPTRPSPPVSGGGLKAKRYKVTRDEDVTLARLVLRVQESSGTKVNLALLNRVANGLMMDAEEDLVREIRAAGPLRQPSNNDAMAYADFENTWRRIIERAIRRRVARS